MKAYSAREQFWAGWLVCTVVGQGLLTVLVLYSNGVVDFGYRIFAALSVSTSLVIPFGVRKALESPSLGWRLPLLWALAVLATLALCGAAGLTALLSLELIAIWGLSGCALLACLGGLLGRGFAPAGGVASGPALVVGDPPEVRGLLDRLRAEGILPLGILGTAADYADSDLAGQWLGEEGDIEAVLDRYAVKTVYLALPIRRFDDVRRLYRDIARHYADVYWVADLAALASLGPAIAVREKLALVGFNLSPRIRNAVTIRIKDLLERVIAALAIVVLLPLLLGIAVAVKLSSPGPVFFRQARHGCDGRVIVIWKFRSMVLHHEQGVTQARRQDPRVTRVGRLLRRTSLDELPQLFNVLQGRLALVGPRPHALAHNAFYEQRIALYNVRHSLKPGITGLAQVSGCRGETDRVDKMQRRVAYDLHYIRNWSLWMDVKILAKTPFTLFAKDIY